MLQALIWDVDGTLAETERDGHRVAFNQAFESMKLPWRWDSDLYGRLLRVTGGRERLLHDMASRPDAPDTAAARMALATELHQRKNAAYAELVRAGGIALRPGVRELIDEAAARGLRQAIATTTSRVNLDALLRTHLGAAWTERFAAIVCGEDVQLKKPDPEAYVRALGLLELSPLQTLAIEDSPGGAAAARGADVPVLVTRSVYFADDTLEGAVAIGPGLDQRAGWRPDLPGQVGRVTLDDLIDWHARMELVSDYG